MDPKPTRAGYSLKHSSMSGSSSPLFQACSSFSQSRSHTRLRFVSLLSVSSLYLVVCCGKLPSVCFVSSCSYGRTSHTGKKTYLNVDKKTIYVPCAHRVLCSVRAADGSFNSSVEGKQPFARKGVTSSDFDLSFHRDLYRTVYNNAEYQNKNLVHAVTCFSSRSPSSSIKEQVTVGGQTETSHAYAENDSPASQRTKPRLFDGGRKAFSTSNASKLRRSLTGTTPYRNYASSVIWISKDEASLAGSTWSKQRMLQPEAPTLSLSTTVSTAHPGVSVLGRVGQNAEVNGEYKLVKNDTEKGFLFKKLLRSNAEGTPLYLFSSSFFVLQQSEQPQQRRSIPVYWAIGEVPYENTRIRAFAVGDAAYPDLITGIWSVFEQQNSEMVVAPDKFVSVVRVGCNNGALDGSETGMDCGGSCEVLCENMRYCHLPRTLPEGYALGSCPLDGVLQHGEGCTYKCPLGWKEGGALGRVCYDGTLLEIRRGSGCEEAFSSTSPHAQQCQFLLLEGAPSKQTEMEAQSARALAEVNGMEAAGRGEDNGGGGTSILPRRVDEKRSARKELGEDTDVGLSRKGGVAWRGRVGGASLEDGRASSRVAARGLRVEPRWEKREKLRRASRTRRIQELFGGEEREREARKQAKGQELRFPLMTDGVGPARITGSKEKEVGEGLPKVIETTLAGRELKTERARTEGRSISGVATSRRTGAVPTQARRREAGAAVGEAPEKGSTDGGVIEGKEEAEQHVCNGLFIMNAVRGASGQRAVFWQRDADGILVQLYWEDGYWVCASFEKDVEYGYVWDPLPSKLVLGNAFTQETRTSQLPLIDTRPAP